MSSPSGHALAAAIAGLPRRFPGPGGAAAVLRDGVVLEAGAWGFADAEARAPFRSDTLFPVCSITKQFTCATVLRHAPDPERLAPLLRDRLPLLEARPSVASLCHNQSGLRDSWALATISGAPPEGRFDDDDTAALFGRLRSLQFASGTRYSYSNGNFRLLSDLLERDTGRPFATLLREGVLDAAAMPTARLVPDTARWPAPITGHEGGESEGWRPVVNRIVWRGDAGLLASLDDMIAWERFIDRTREDAASPYALLARPVEFADRRPAQYGWGLARFRVAGQEATGHGGALRGFRATRLRIGSARLSVVVLFNHRSEARLAAIELARAALGAGPDAPVRPREDDGARWWGRFVDDECGLAATLAPEDAKAGSGPAMRLGWATVPDTLRPTADPDVVASETVTLRRIGDGIRMERALDGMATTLRPVPDGDVLPADLVGAWRSDELDAVLTIVDAGGVLMAAAGGPAGEGRMEPLRPYGPDRALMPCPRALDEGAPGDWTLLIRRDETGQARALTVGCWLARGLGFRRI